MLMIARISEIIKKRIPSCEEKPKRLKSKIMRKLMRFRDENGNTPLHFAAWKNDQDLLNFLASNLPEKYVCMKNRDGNTPLHFAVGKIGSLPYNLCVDELRNTQNKKGNTPLHIAIRNGNFELVICLVNKENVNTQNKQGNTPLHFAAWKNHRHAIRILLARGAGRCAINKDGQMPINLAKCRFSREELTHPTGKFECFTDEDQQQADFVFHVLTYPGPNHRDKVRISYGDDYEYFVAGSESTSHRAVYHARRAQEFYEQQSS